MYVLIGAGGHSKVVCDILLASNRKVIGFLDDNTLLKKQCSFPILGKISLVPKLIEENKNIKFIIAIGSNCIREEIEKRLKIYPVEYGTAVHPSAIIGNDVHIKGGTVVMPNSVINNSSIIGKHVIINTGSTIDHDCKVEDFCHISPGVNLAGNVEVGKNTHVGIGACVIQGINIGAYSQVGAGGVVVTNIGTKKLAVGCPAKEIKDYIIKGI